MERLLLFCPCMSSNELSAPIALDVYRALRRQSVGDAFAVMQRQRTPQAAKRKLPRAAIALPLTLHLDEWETDTQTLDISEGGYSFMASAPPTQEILPFALELHPRRVIRGHARVVAHIAAGSRYRVCVSFSKLDAEAKNAITDRVLDTIEESMAAA